MRLANARRLAGRARIARRAPMPARRALGYEPSRSERDADAKKMAAIKAEGKRLIQEGDYEGAMEQIRSLTGVDVLKSRATRADIAAGGLRPLGNEYLARAMMHTADAVKRDTQTLREALEQMEKATMEAVADGKAAPDSVAAEDAKAVEAEIKKVHKIMEGISSELEKGGKAGISPEAFKNINARLAEASLAAEEVMKKVDVGDARLYDEDTGKAVKLTPGEDASEDDIHPGDLRKDHKFTFMDTRGSAGLSLYGTGVKTVDRGYETPPVGADMGLIMEDPTQMDPRLNPDLPYTIDDAEGIIVLHFHKGPYKGEEVVLASVSSTIEWVVPSPPPLHLFDESPVTKEFPPEWADAEFAH